MIVYLSNYVATIMLYIVFVPISNQPFQSYLMLNTDLDVQTATCPNVTFLDEKWMNDAPRMTELRSHQSSVHISM